MNKFSCLPEAGELAGIPVVAGVAPARHVLSAGDALFRRGDETFGIFFLASGKLRMQRVTADGGVVSLHVARPGELFAEASLFAERYQCDAVAESDCEVWRYPKAELESRLRTDSSRLWAFAAVLASGLHSLRLRYEIKQIRSAPDRVLQFLKLRSDAGGVFHVGGSLKDIAPELGLSHEAFYRALSKLVRDKQVSRSRGNIRLTGCMVR